MNLQSILQTISLRPPVLKRVIPCCGAAAFLLYKLLYVLGVDGRGLLKSGHFAWVLLCILSLAVGALILVSTARLPEGEVRFRRSLPAAVCAALAAISTLATGMVCLGSGLLLYAIPALAAAVCFAAVALGRFRGQKIHFLPNALLCVHFIFQLLQLYRSSSFDPQVQDYFFQMLACIALAVTAYQQAAAELGQGSRRWLWGAGMAAVYLSMLSLGSSSTGLFLTGAAWAFTAFPTPIRKREQAEG